MDKNTDILAIDPGKDGGICKLNGSGDILELIRMPTYMAGDKKKMKKLIDFPLIVAMIHSVGHVVMEKAQVMPSFSRDKFGNVKKSPQGNVSVFNYGTDYGTLIGICIGANIPHDLVHPRTWTATMKKDMAKGKGSSILRAKQLCPNINLLATERCSKPHDGMAESFLIGRYYLQHLADDF